MNTLYQLAIEQAIVEPADDYHAKARSGEFVGSHLLADFRESPAIYQAKIDGRIHDKDSSAYALGRALHTYVLEGEQAFACQYEVGGPINPKTLAPFGRDTKAWAEFAAKAGKPIVTLEDVHTIAFIDAAVQRHEYARLLLRNGVAERVFRATISGVPCQIRTDWLSAEYGALLVDLKSTEDLTFFENDARRYGYIAQLAFYCQVLALAIGVSPVDIPVAIIGAEKTQPFRCGTWILSPESLAQAQQVNVEALRRLAECRNSGVWPTGYEQPRELMAV